jgi:hypothetical protein
VNGLPAPGPSRHTHLDEVKLRERLEEWDDGMRVVVPVELLRKLTADLDAARNRSVYDRAIGDAARDAVAVWGCGLVEVARELGVVVTTGDALEDLVRKSLAEVRGIRRRLLLADVEASEHRATRGLLEALFGGAIR